ncbi:MAG: hypothetical protein H6908_00950 [Hyphomicrobiales bacterium]|nr:hypothetical protein [Rickettsiales bacterium]MCP5361199.1 hypothetical protein [Hyphomicrobiales bacterium]
MRPEDDENGFTPIEPAADPVLQKQEPALHNVPVKKRSFLRHIWEAVLAFVILIVSGSAMAAYFIARTLFRYLILFPLSILQTALYILLNTIRKSVALVIVGLVIVGGAFYLYADFSGMDKPDFGNITKYFHKLIPADTLSYETLGEAIPAEQFPQTLAPMQNITLPSEDIHGYLQLFQQNQLGDKAEAAVPLLRKTLGSQDEASRMAAYEALTLIGTHEAIDAIIDYYNFVEEYNTEKEKSDEEHKRAYCGD